MPPLLLMDLAPYTVELEMKNRGYLSIQEIVWQVVLKVVVSDKLSRKAKSNGMTEFTQIPTQCEV